jgi:Xaa-Pro aminopeptidase
MQQQGVAQGVRVRSIRGLLKNAGLDAIILTRASDVTYVTGFLGQDSWAVVTSSAAYLITDSRYVEQARQECPTVRIVERKDATAQAAGRLLNKLKSAKTVGVEKSVSVGIYQALKKHLAGSLKAVDGLMTELRTVKDESETAAIHHAADLAAEALERMLPAMRPGVTESELAALLDLEIRRLGSRNSFDTIVAFGPNASRPHHQPTLRKLKPRDTVLIDFGAQHEGYCSDITRCFVIGGRPTREYRRAYETVERAQVAAIDAICSGADIGDIDAKARAVIRESGFPVYGHGTGHGLGLDIHEAPFLREKIDGKLQSGQIITIEPGIYIPGVLGIRIEDDVLVTDSGGRILTEACPHTPLCG